MTPFDFPRQVDHADIRRKVVSALREKRIVLPTFAQLAAPDTIPAEIRSRLADVPPDAPHADNLFRVHWFNDRTRAGGADVPAHLVLPPSLTGVPAKIIVALGAFFPMIAAHKVLAAYACLVPRLVSGRFDPENQLAVWPSTGNYCRGGVAISRILGCRGVAVLPEGMSRERFSMAVGVGGQRRMTSSARRAPRATSRRSTTPATRSPGTRPMKSSTSSASSAIISAITPAAGRRWRARSAALRRRSRRCGRSRFVAASGSSGTLGAGDYLKDTLGAKIAVVEPVECPTLLYNGFGEHNIQGIGDKHVPLIHNVMNTDFVIAVSDKATDGLNAVFNTDAGRSHLVEERSLAADLVSALSFVGLSGIANILAAIKLAKYHDLGEDDAILTVATDGAGLYESELDDYLSARHPGGLTRAGAAALAARHLDATGTDHLLEASETDRNRIFNLGYYTWVEQRGIALADFEARRHQSFWRGLRELLPVWDEMIDSVNSDAGILAA